MLEPLFRSANFFGWMTDRAAPAGLKTPPPRLETAKERSDRQL